MILLNTCTHQLTKIHLQFTFALQSTFDIHFTFTFVEHFYTSTHKDTLKFTFALHSTFDIHLTFAFAKQFYTPTHKDTLQFTLDLRSTFGKYLTFAFHSTFVNICKNCFPKIYHFDHPDLQCTFGFCSITKGLPN